MKDDGIITQLKREVKELVGKEKEEDRQAGERKLEKVIEEEKEKGKEQGTNVTAAYTVEKKYEYYSTPAIDKAGRVLHSAMPRAFRAAVVAAAVTYAYVLTTHPATLTGLGIAAFDFFVGLENLSLWMRSAAAAGVSTTKKKAGFSIIKFNVHEVPSAIERSRAYRWARKEFQERLRIASSGVALAGSTTTRARKYLNVVLALSPAMTFAAGAASVMAHPYFAFLMAVPGVVIAAPFLSLKLKKAERSEIADELPFFLIIAEMMAMVEKPLIHVFEIIARSGDMLPKIRVESEVVRRDVNAFGYTPDQAIGNLAKTHPNAELRSILHGYLSSVSLGQSVAQYFQNKAETYLARLEARYERYRENAGTVGELVLIMLMIVPLTASISSPSTGGPSPFMLVAAIPSISVAMFFMLDRAQVRDPDTANGGYQQGRRLPLLPAAAAAMTALVTLVVYPDPVIMLLASVSAFAIPNGIMARRRIGRDDMALLELAEFIRSVAEVMKTGLDVISAIRYAGTDRFTLLKHPIRQIKHRLSTGDTLDSVSVNVNFSVQTGFYMKYALLIMSALASSGATSYAMLDRLAEYLGRVREQNAKVKKSVMMYSFLVVTSPLFMMFTIRAMASMTAQFLDPLSGAADVPGIGKMPTFISHINPDSPLVKAMLVLTALGAGVLSGKMENRTIMDTIPLALACIITLVSPMLLDVVWPIPQAPSQAP